MINMAMKLINSTEPMVVIVLCHHIKEYFDRFTAFVTLLINHMTSLLSTHKIKIMNDKTC
jgi:hypothetical protein